MNERTITVKWDAAATSQNKLRGMGTWQMVAAIREAREAGFRGWIDSGKPVWREQVAVDIIVRKAREMDEANLCGACKAAMDGVFVGRQYGRIFLPAALPDDSPKWLKLGTVRQEVDKRWLGNEEILFIVRPTRKVEQDGA